MSKHIVLIRHGESEGQQCRGKPRRYRNLLFDSYLTKKGEKQARAIPSFLSDIDIAADFDLICTSPLTRAVATCVLGFGHLHKQVPMICHPDLAEVGGGSTQEDQARPLKKVIRDLTRRYRNNPVAVSATIAIDFSLLPSDWPSNGGGSLASPPSFGGSFGDDSDRFFVVAVGLAIERGRIVGEPAFLYGVVANAARKANRRHLSSQCHPTKTAWSW
eukprot:CAMPEP_0197464318 /NCGR_PEP_ID=MMETSP1175-20131217/63963_1 /TAXON_ID=1003142 /ORGANISM="Triceratium dubium, Strain CCMP147" /LENGTH=216 /DNA_ID=CAMNT_0043000295 /DNA_START=144 /DNA_END=791 /DNA_ORIENTATION=-